MKQTPLEPLIISPSHHAGKLFQSLFTVWVADFSCVHSRLPADHFGDGMLPDTK
jgi:hypothetical protein